MKIIRRFESDVFPWIGAKSVGKVTAQKCLVFFAVSRAATPALRAMVGILCGAGSLIWLARAGCSNTGFV